MSQPIILYHAGHMATKVNELQTHHLKDLCALLRFDKKQTPTLRFASPPEKGQQFSLEAISDASMAKASEGGARGAYVIMRRLGDVTHPIHWSAKKLRRVARSSSTAELLAASDAVSSLTYLQALLSELTYHHKGYMFVDSRALANLATTIREPVEPENKIDLAYIRERFIPTGISAFGWIPGHYNISDGMTKDNRTTAALLINALREGTYPHHPDTVTRYAEHPLTDVACSPPSIPV